MKIVITPQGTVKFIYQEQILLTPYLGKEAIERASHVEPDEKGMWWATILKDKKKLGPFLKRSEALSAEIQYLEEIGF